VGLNNKKDKKSISINSMKLRRGGFGAKKSKIMEAVARLRNYPTSPRKMRLLADLIRGMDVENALNTLKFSTKDPSVPLEKLLVSAVANWKVKNEGVDVADASLFVKTIFVDGGRVLKRMRPAPQGRAYRVRKRSNHITIIVDSRNAVPAATENAEAAA
jgi:large subunit ribosomal protein L22